MTIIRSYLFRQFLRATASVSLILLAIGVVDVLFRLARADIDPETGLYLALLYMINAIVGSILPIGIYFGLFIVVGRLCQSQELYSMYGGGVPRTEVRRVLTLIITPVLLFSVVISFFVYPSLKQQTNRISQASEQERVDRILRRGGIFSSQQLTITSMPASLAPETDLGQPEQAHSDLLVIYRQDNSYLVQQLRDFAFEDKVHSGLDSYKFDKGRVYYRNDKSDTIGQFEFTDSGLGLLSNNRASRPLRAKEKNIIQLWHSEYIDDRIELQKRILTPILFLISFIFASYCAEILPRQSTFSRLPQAMLMLVAVFVTIRFGSDLVRADYIPVRPGLWLFLAPIVLLAFWLYRIRR